MIRETNWIAATSIAGALLATACHGPNDVLPVGLVSISPDSGSIRVGGTTQFDVTLRNANGDTLRDRQVEWTTASAAVALITGSGLAVGMAPGITTIIVTSEGVSDTAAVSVWRGVTGTWSGTLNYWHGGWCDVSATLVEATQGTITGTANICSRAYTIVGSNNVGGVPDSLGWTWSGAFGFLGSLAQVDGRWGVVGYILDGTCGVSDPNYFCDLNLQRGSVTP